MILVILLTALLSSGFSVRWYFLCSLFFSFISDFIPLFGMSVLGSVIIFLLVHFSSVCAMHLEKCSQLSSISSGDCRLLLSLSVLFMFCLKSVHSVCSMVVWMG